MPRKPVTEESIIGKIVVENDRGEIIRPWCGQEIYLTNEADLGVCFVIKGSKHKRGHGIFLQVKNIVRIFPPHPGSHSASILTRHMQVLCTVHIISSEETKAQLQKFMEIIQHRSLWSLIPFDQSKKDGKRDREDGGMNLSERSGRAELHEDSALESRVVISESNTRRKSTTVRRIPNLEPFGLNEEQKRVMHTIGEGRNVFISGCAGTGKSHLLKTLVQIFPENEITLTASTGIAALELQGQTLHSFAGLGATNHMPLETALQRILARPSTVQGWKQASLLVIDEISMIHASFFQLLDDVARAVRRRPYEAFGGIQLVVAGDFLQLPPVHRSSDPMDQTLFCFETSGWSEAQFVTFDLQEVFRQRDPQFVQILKKIRLGNVSSHTLSILQSRIQPMNVIDVQATSGGWIQPTSLCATQKEVDRINERALQSLPSQEVHTYESIDDAENEYYQAMLARDTNLPQILKLKLGAQVVLLGTNTSSENAIRGLVNGSRGVVIGFRDQDGLPIVRFDSWPEGNRTEVISSVQQHVHVRGKAVGSRQQIPLRCAWALSIHKSQGMSIDRLQVAIDSTVFEYGQAYVALSRCVSLDGLYLTALDLKAIRAHPKVLQFYGYDTEETES